MSIPDAWTERVFVSTATQGGSFNSCVIHGTVNIARGEKDYEGTALLNGGRVPKFTPEKDTEVTIKTYPVNVGTASSFAQWFNRTYDATEPLSTSPTLFRDKMEVVVLWTNNPNQANATDAVPTGYAALRYTFANAYLTKCSPEEFAPDGTYSEEVVFKLSPFNKSATANITEESSDGTSQLTAVSSYT